MTRVRCLLVTWLPAGGVQVGLLRRRETWLSESDNIMPVPYAVFCGLDVGKSAHHACALNTAGERVHDKALPNDETHRS